MRIDHALATRRPCFSFEFSPPQNEEGERNLLAAARSLRVLDPAFLSVTYGAGGSTRVRSFEVAKKLNSELDVEVMAHVTCAGHTREELCRLFSEYAAAGFENVLALRGDPPRGDANFRPAEGGFRYASELIELLHEEFDFTIGAAAYPETHPEAASPADDLARALLKVRSGARFLITQLFFDNERYFDFVARARAAGIDVPIVPGIMPITNYRSIARMSAMCGSSIPQQLLAELERRADEPEAVAELGVAFCTLQVQDLLARGAPGVHFYTLNRSPATRAVVSALLAARSTWERIPAM